MAFKKHGQIYNKKIQAFTIVELLVVIVIIGILAAISIVSYTGIRERAIAVRITSDLSNDSTLLELYKIEHNVYPDSLDASNCPDLPEPDDRYCLIVSEDDDILTYDGGDNDYTLTITDDDFDIAYKITAGGVAVAVAGGSGQALPSSFMYSWGGSGSESVTSVTNSVDGTYVMVGSSESFGVNGPNAIITKFNLDGTNEWSKVFGQDGSTSFESVIQTSDGGYAVAGSYTDGDGNTGFYVAKITSNGVLSWDKTWFGDYSYDFARSIIQTSDGGYAVAGAYYIYDDINDSIQGDAYIAKLDSSGNVSWDKTWGGDYDDSAGSIVQTSDGDYAITGTTNSFGDENGDAFLAKFTSAGALSWDYKWGGANYDEALSLAEDEDGNLAITGVTYSFNDTDNGDSFIAKFASDGSMTWDKTWGGPYYDYGRSVILVEDGNFAVSGNNRLQTEYSARSNITKFNSNGDITWQRAWGFGEEGYVIQNIDDSYSLVGLWSGDLSAGYDDIFVIKYDLDGDIEYEWDGTMYPCEDYPCEDQTISSLNISATVGSLSATIGSPSATEGTPNVTNQSLNPTITPIVISQGGGL